MLTRSRPAKRPKRYVSPNLLSQHAQNAIMACICARLPARGHHGYDAMDYLGSVFWSKFTSPGYSQYTGKADSSPGERASRATEKWLSMELRNTQTNGRILFDRCDFGWATSDEVIALARRFILDLIGSSPSLGHGQFSGGASTRIKRGPDAIQRKFVGKAHVTTEAVPYFGPHLFENPGWGRIGCPSGLKYEAVRGNVMFTVPKNSEIDRPACKEPEINMYLQRAAGLTIRNRLKRVGIDLKDQSRNRELAREGSITGRYATLDLSSASDTVSTAVVKLLLPHGWFSHLDALRCKETRLPSGDWHVLQMFSSMGNGFTFELETLIFWALTRAVAYKLKRRGKIRVFGDDIICDTQVGKALERVLAWFGFVVNVKKTFTSGPFRESCGGHYHRGVDITPVYFHERIRTMTQLIQLMNQLTEWSLRCEISVWGSDEVIGLLTELREFVPSYLHGGQSFQRTDALVTGDAPRRRLTQLDEPFEVTQLGAYLAWYHAKLHPNESVETSEAPRLGKWVLRPNSAWYEAHTATAVKLLYGLRHD